MKQQAMKTSQKALLVSVLVAGLLVAGGGLYTLRGPSLAAHASAQPAAPTAPDAPNTAVLQVEYLTDGQKDLAERDCYAWPVEAQAAFNQAVNIWSTLIYTPDVPIFIQACWTDLPSNLFPYGYDAQPASWIPQYGAPDPGLNSYYPLALANTRFGDDLDPIRPEISISVNRTTAWHFPMDANPPAGTYDFLTASLRQITFGLGFRGFMKVESGLGYWTLFQDPYPALYDRFVVNGSGRALITYADGSTALGTQLQSDNLYFDGYSSRIANGGVPVRLHAPAPWLENGSYIHLYSGYQYTENGLMAPPIPGTAYYDPGPVTLGIMRDLGWDITRNSPPLLAGLPDMEMPMNSSLKSGVDLWPYASDVESADDALLTFSISGATPTNPGVSIQNGHYLSVSLQGGWHGSTSITVRVQDPGEAYSYDDFIITTTNSAPTMSDLPDIVAPANIPYTQVLDLRRLAYDFEDARRYLTFSIINTPDAQAGVGLSGDGGRFLDIIPDTGFLGSTSVTIQVMDRGGLTDSDTFNVTVTDQNVTPTINIENQYVFINTTRTVDLLDWDWDKDATYARDPEGETITLQIINTPDPNAGVTLADNRYINIVPALDWVGRTDVTIRVQDPGLLSASETFEVIVWRYEPTFLPMIYRNYNPTEE